jgi:hypothetical protein
MIKLLPYPQLVAKTEDLVHDLDASRPDLRIGMPEREIAREALEAHLAAERIDSTEYEQRWVTCQEARTQAELLQTFADLPAPHPRLPGLPGPSADIDDDIPPLAMSICAALLLGMPVAVVLGFVYGAWWTLAVPVTLSIAMLYIEHLLTRAPNRRPEESVGRDFP